MNSRPSISELLSMDDPMLRRLAPNATHQHNKGGLYSYIGIIMDADTGQPLTKDGEVVHGYMHEFPLTKALWGRRESEMLDGRFRQLGYK